VSASADAGPALVAGTVAEAVRAEFPELALLSVTVPARTGRSTRDVRRQLRLLSDRFRGAQAITMRQDPVPWAYRVFFRHLGLDPDVQRTPIEALALERLVHGGLRSRGLLDDALAIALFETGVPLWALDAATVDGGLGIRPAVAGERLGRAPGAPPLAPGCLVVADGRSPLAVLCGALAPGHGVTPASREMALFTVRVAGVTAIHVEEAFWRCLEVLGTR